MERLHGGPLFAARSEPRRAEQRGRAPVPSPARQTLLRGDVGLRGAGGGPGPLAVSAWRGGGAAMATSPGACSFPDAEEDEGTGLSWAGNLVLGPEES